MSSQDPPTRRLTETSFIVLGLLEQAQPATPYHLKQLAQLSTANFWNVPHTQLYGECARLASEGLLEEQREESGRRRRIYRLTDRGESALRQWRDEPTDKLYELRDVTTLKLFFGGDPAVLAGPQLKAHERRLGYLEEVRANVLDAPHGWLLALNSGIAHEREYIRFWSQLGEDDAG